MHTFSTVSAILLGFLLCSAVATFDDDGNPYNDNTILDQIHLASVTEFWDNFMYANASLIVNGLKPVPNIVANNSLGRVNPTLHVLNKNKTVEYIFGINSHDFFGFTGSSYYFENFQNEGDRCSVKVVVSWVNATGYAKGTISLIGQYRFLTDLFNLGKIIEYEITAINLGHFWIALGLDWRTEAVQTQITQSICDIHEAFCGDYRQYANGTECMEKLMSLPFGTPNEFRMNDRMCRQVHGAMAIPYPKDHCHHLAYISEPCAEKTEAELVAPLFPGDPKRLIR